MPDFETIGIAGAGAWGTALAISTARAGRKVVLWGRDAAEMTLIAKTRMHLRRMPGIRLEPAINVTGEIALLKRADVVLLAVPAQTFKAFLADLPGADAPLVICAKGLMREGDLRLSELIAAELPRRPVAALSGPNFAREVALGLPTAATLGCPDRRLGEQLAATLSSETFRLYWTDDLIGVEIGGAVKNVLAIAAGIVAGRQLGENAAAALITRGLAELSRLAHVLGARTETQMGLAGLGDLILTAGSRTSRNMAFGFAIGEGADPSTLCARPDVLVEGVYTAGAIARLARQHGVDLPICSAVDDILEGRLEISDALERLMSRPLKAEGADLALP